MSIRTATFNGVATIEIARPEKKNAFTAAMYAAFAEALRAADSDASVRAALVTGQPGMFSSGNDIEEFLARIPAAGESAGVSPALQLMQAVLDVEKPLVAAVTGAAVGIGATLLLHCDLVYVADDARIAMPFVGLGLVPEFASSVVLPQLVGRVRASEKLLLGDPMSGADAVEFGIANAVLPADEVVNHARRVAERFNRLPPTSVRESILGFRFDFVLEPQEVQQPMDDEMLKMMHGRDAELHGFPGNGLDRQYNIAEDTPGLKLGRKLERK